jgi:acetaldehyde dehydrogenase
MVVPTESVPEDFTENNINLISCGGQATIPILSSISREFGGLEYVEIITTASSPSVGRATRINIDEYIHTAERAIKKYTKVPVCKAILNISVAHPPVPFRVAMHVSCKTFELERVKEVVKEAEFRVQAYAGGYRLLTCEKMEEGRLYISVEVEGQGDFIPKYSGNLDIINSSAIVMAENIAKSIQLESVRN